MKQLWQLWLLIRRVKRKFWAIIRQRLFPCCCCWVVLVGTAKSRLMTESCCQTTHWIKPCEWWIWPKSLWCLPLSPSLSLSPSHAYSQEFIKCHQSLVRSEGTCFPSCFHHFMSNRNVFPMSNPPPRPSSLPPFSCFPSSIYPPLSLMA